MHKKLALALAVCYTMLLTILSLITVNQLPKLGSTFDDKIYHFGAYMVLTILWYNFLTRTSSKFIIAFSALISIVYGIIVEVIQGAFTTSRTEDYIDVFANSIGVFFGILLILTFRKLKLK